MDEKRKQKIIQILKQNDSNSISFSNTKKQLLSAGFSDKEIVLALYEFPYDGKPNRISHDNKVQKFYENNPAAAAKSAKYLLKDLERKDRMQAIGYGAASLAAGNIRDYHAQSYYTSRFLDTQGLSFFKMFGIVAIVTILGIKFNRLDEAYAALVIGFCIYVGYLVIKRFLRL